MYSFTELLGDWLYYTWTSRRALVEQNLSCALNSKTAQVVNIDVTARLLFRNWAKNLYEVSRMPAVTREYIETNGTIIGWEYIEASYKRGQGVILVSAHSGPYWYTGLIPAYRGIPNTVVVQQSQLVNAMSRYTSRVKLQHRFLGDDGSPRELLRQVRQGETISLMVDRALGHANVEVELFGRPIHLPLGHVWLALKSGAPLIVCFARRLDGKRYVVRCRPPMQFEVPTRGKSFQEAMHQGTALVARELEEEIGPDLSQWLTLMWDKL